jgi:hypothetical protein
MRIRSSGLAVTSAPATNRQNGGCGALLIVMPDWNGHTLARLVEHRKAFRLGDVFEVDASE